MTANSEQRTANSERDDDRYIESWREREGLERLVRPEVHCYMTMQVYHGRILTYVRMRRVSFAARQKSSSKNIGRRRGTLDKQKQLELMKMMEAHQDKRGNETLENVGQAPLYGNDDQLDNERTKLFHEATLVTKSLYRTCIRCVKIIQQGNNNDERLFKLREDAQQASRATGNFLFEPSVDRENELKSRAMYYLALVKESFNQEVDCLTSNPWREENLTRFFYLLRTGEDKRKWVLKDYHFDDPYPDNFDEERLHELERKAWCLVNQTYQRKGWLSKTRGLVTENLKYDNDIDWGDDDSEKNKKY